MILSDKPVNPLVFAQWNAEGLRKKKPELQEFLKRNQVDIICIQETHLSDAQRFSVRGYEPFRHDRLHCHKGGILTLVKNTIPAVEIARSMDGSGTEYIAVKAVLPDQELLIVNVYCSPDRDLQLHTLPHQEKNLLILGDLNGHSPSWGYEDLNTRGEQIEDWMMDNGLVLINRPDDKPTCLSRAWKTLSTPDLAIATDDIQKVCTREVANQLGGSDHRPVLLQLHQTGSTWTGCKEPSWNYKKANWTKFREQNDKLCRENGPMNTEDINLNVDRFTTAILHSAKQSIPRGRRKDYKPFWSDRLQELHEQLSTAREDLENERSPETIRAHNKARALFDEEKTKETRRAWHEKTESLNMEKDTGKLWKLTKVLNKDHQTTPRATVLQENDQLYTGKRAASLLAETFRENSHLDVTREKTAEVRRNKKNELRKLTPSTAMTAEFTIQELNHAIGKLKNKKAPGKDNITNEMVKQLSKHAKECLLSIFNQSWNTGTFPHNWKEATIIPIPKKGKDKSNKTSYRPISLLSCLAKTMERMVNRRLQYHLEKNDLLSPIQSGFRRHRGTEDQIAYLTQDVEDAFQKKMKTLAVFVDLKSAFDKVWKEGLLIKLLRKQVCGKMFAWIENYLFQRTARVKLGGHLSNLVKLREGVPQGGVISPTLFVIFIDDIADQLTCHIPRALHADDLAVWTSAEHATTVACRMQTALNSISSWAHEWMVTINKTKTEATMFSLSPKKEAFTLTIDGQDVPHQETPTYLGVKLDRKLTWGPNISSMETKAVKKTAVMKKLAGTRWGANSKILTQVYTGSVRPLLEYASTSWSTAAKTNTARLTKVHNQSLRLITGGIKTTPISAMEKTTRLQSLEERRTERILRQTEKMKRLPSHPLHAKLQEPTKNRLKRQSLNHLAKAHQRHFSNVLPPPQQQVEPLQDYDEWSTAELNIVLDVHGVGAKGSHSEAELRSLTLEMLDKDYPPNTWTHIFTDGSAENAVRNGGGGIYIKFPDGSRIEKSIPTGQLSTNFRAEACALLHATETLNAREEMSTHSVILTDCRSLLQSLQTEEESQIMRNIRHALEPHTKRTHLTLQWIPSHCGVSGNEQADRLSKAGSRQEQPSHPVSYKEARTMLKSQFKTEWRQKHRVGAEEDAIWQLERAQQVIIFRLRTGHCQLLSHLYRLRLSPTDDCPCGTGPQTPEHLLQDCPTFNILRREAWPCAVELRENLWGPAAALRRTADFALQTGLKI